METRITATQMVNFQTLDRFNHFRLDKFSILINTCRSLDSINQSSCSWTKEFRIFTSYDLTIWQFEGKSRTTCFFSLSACCNDHLAIFRSNTKIIHEQLNLLDSSLRNTFIFEIKNGLIVATDDFLFRSFFGCLIIRNGKTNHVNTHIRR